MAEPTLDRSGVVALVGEGIAADWRGASARPMMCLDNIGVEIVTLVAGASPGIMGSSSRAIWFGIFIGSAIGGLIPELWRAGAFSYSSVLFSGIGAFAGLWIGLRVGN
jgi:hypothetical protein